MDDHKCACEFKGPDGWSRCSLNSAIACCLCPCHKIIAEVEGSDVKDFSDCKTCNHPGVNKHRECGQSSPFAIDDSFCLCGCHIDRESEEYIRAKAEHEFDKAARKYRDRAKRIVAEISVPTVIGDMPQPTLSHDFQKVISVNEGRGYIMEDWKFTSTAIDGSIVDTIIAVFVRKD